MSFLLRGDRDGVQGDRGPPPVVELAADCEPLLMERPRGREIVAAQDALREETPGAQPGSCGRARTRQKLRQPRPALGLLLALVPVLQQGRRQAQAPLRLA